MRKESWKAGSFPTDTEAKRQGNRDELGRTGQEGAKIFKQITSHGQMQLGARVRMPRTSPQGRTPYPEKAQALLSLCVKVRPCLGWRPGWQRSQAVDTGPQTHVSPLRGRKGPPWTGPFAEAPGADTRGQTNLRSPTL